MAFSNKHQFTLDEDAPKHVTIIAGPTFGEAVKFVVFGALLGAGATYAYLQSKPPAPAIPATDPLQQGLTAGGAKTDEKALTARLGKVAERLKNVAGGAASIAKSAALTAAPLVSQAVVEGRRAAQETQSEMERDLENAKTETQAEAARIKAEREAKENSN